MANRARSGPESQPGQPIGLRTLGEYLNLSPATISLVLNNAPGVRSIPQETRDRVREAAARFDYRPSFYARSLRKRQSFSVGVLVPELSDSYAMQVLAGAEEFLLEEGYFYLIASHRRKPDLIEEYSSMLIDRSVEGFILIDTVLKHSMKLPVVAVAGHRKIEGVTNVVLDQRRAAELTLRHLYQLGHRKIAFMRGGSHSSDADDRWECLMAVARELKLEVAPRVDHAVAVAGLDAGAGIWSGERVARIAAPISPPWSAMTIWPLSARSGPLWTMACGFRRTSPWWASTTSRARRTTTPA